MHSALAQAGAGLLDDGLKIGVRPRDLPLIDRLAVVSRLLSAMQG